MEKLTCAQAKQIDLVSYLASLGYHPEKIRNNDYWYLSPLRNERTASFKVDRKLNLWYDHGGGNGGDLIDFGTQYYRCGISEFLNRVSQNQPEQFLSFHPPSLPGDKYFAGEKKEESKIIVLETRPISDPLLLSYLQKRSIPLDIARGFCTEVDFTLYGKKHTAIGFQNNAGGYELRSEYFKGSSAPKDITLIDNKTDDLTVFEGFFNFLSFQTINRNLQAPLTNCLVLNSLSFFERSRALMENYKQIHLILDRDNAGMAQTKQALQWSSKYIDRSDYYSQHKDLNDWLKQKERKPKQVKGFRRRL